jgi:hypothetical protein
MCPVEGGMRPILESLTPTFPVVGPVVAGASSGRNTRPEVPALAAKDMLVAEVLVRKVGDARNARAFPRRP